jgi:hypothetical protein
VPQQLTTSVENNFTKGLITESTGLNFPENAATDVDNCEFTLVGDVLRREGIDYEINYATHPVTRANQAVSSYKWNNAGGDGLTQVVVEQVGATLYFYKSSAATVASPLSTQNLASTVTISSFVAINGSFDATLECQYADGNGYLFVYHPSCDPFYCTYVAGTIIGNAITIQIRDFLGVPETVAVTNRPAALSNEHQYNITNQGWIKGTPWSGTSTTTVTASVGVKNFTTQAGLTVSVGDRVSCLSGQAAFPGGVYQPAGSLIIWGAVTGYSGTTLTINIDSVSTIWAGNPWAVWVFSPTSTGYVDTFKSASGSYPSNSDVWWYYKNSTGGFDPAATINNVTINSGNAPQGHFILPAFTQQRSLVGNVTGLTDIITTARPRTGTWFQGRVWYTGIDAQQAATGDAPYYTWTENIYFSQIVQGVTDFGMCYQQNDPTSETLFDLLPTDGGVITIQGCGSIYKLFPIQNGMLVFASNGVWFITGSQGIGFSANDYTITKVSAIQSISPTSFVDVNGLPYFWNEEGIYTVQPTQGGALQVEPITVGTILSFYNEIPTVSKRYARGAYDPIDYNIQWIYRDSVESTINDRYTYDKMLNFNTYNKAFFPYTVDTTLSSINSILYVSYPGGISEPNPSFKYLVSTSNTISVADEHDTTYVDWLSRNGVNYVSYFVTGYKLRGQAIKKFQPQYIQMWLRTNDASSSYKIQGLWDFANDRNSGRWSSIQLISVPFANFSTLYKRHKIRGHGFALQFKVISVDGQPFDIQGWAIVDTVNQGT